MESRSRSLTIYWSMKEVTFIVTPSPQMIAFHYVASIWQLPSFILSNIIKTLENVMVKENTVLTMLWIYGFSYIIIIKINKN